MNICSYDNSPFRSCQGFRRRLTCFFASGRKLYFAHKIRPRFLYKWLSCLLSVRRFSCIIVSLFAVRPARTPARGREGPHLNVNDTDLSVGSITRQLVRFVIPIWLGALIQQFYNMADAMFVGNYVGKAALAAVGGPCSQITTLMVCFFVDLAAGCSVIVAQYFGARDEKNVGRALHTAMAIAFIGGFALIGFGFACTPWLMRVMDASGEIYTYGKTYLYIYFGGMFFVTFYNLGSSTLRALGDSKSPFYALVAGCFTNIFLDWLFIAKFGFGVAGAAAATVISEGLSCVFILRSLSHLPEAYRLHFKKISIHRGIIGSMLRIGVPESTQTILYSITNIMIQTNIDGFGTNAIAAMSAYSKVDAFCWVTLDSFGVAITAISGQYYGAGKVDGVRRSVRVCAVLAAVSMTVIGGILLLLGPQLFTLFTRDPDVITIALEIQRLLVPFYLSFIGVVVLSGALRGMGYSFVPMFITLVGICIVRVIWLLTVVPLRPEFMTTIWSYPVTWTITSIAFLIYYRRMIRRECRLHA